MSHPSEAVELLCVDCLKTFRRQRDYNKHRKTHDRPFPCFVCHKRFGLKTDLGRHLSAVHSSPRYPCTFANCKFKPTTRKEYLRKHMKRKHVSIGSDEIDKAIAEASNQFLLQDKKAGSTPFLEAICQGKEEEVQDFISKGIDLSWEDREGKNVGVYAIEHGQVNMLKLLLRNGLSVTEFGNKCLMLDTPAARGDADMLKMILKHRHKARITKALLSNSLVHAIRAGKLATVEVLLDAGADLDNALVLWRTFDICPFEGLPAIDCLRYTLNRSNHDQRYGNTKASALHLCVLRYPDLVAELIGQGALINALDNQNRTPLSYALGTNVFRGFVETNFSEQSATHLLDAGATISPNDWERMPPSLQEKYGHLRQDII